MLRSLQIGRALAALAVAAYHLSIGFTDPRIAKPAIFADYTGHGYLGVDYFFVLSGFIILFAHRRDLGKPDRIRDYARKRFVRVYPMYWVLTAVTIAGTLAVGGVKSIPSSVADVATTISLVHFNEFATPIGSAWTLYHEILFYAVFGIFLLNVAAGLVVAAGWLLLIVLTFHYSPHGEWSFWNTLTSASNLSFFAGIIAYVAADRIRNAAAIMLMVVGIVMLGLVYWLELDLGRLAVIQLGYSVAFMSIVAGLVGAERSGIAFRVPLFGLIGDASYTLYLAHESIESTLLKLAKRAHLLDHIDLRVAYFLILAATVAISIAIYLAVEKPLLGYFRAATAARRTAATA